MRKVFLYTFIGIIYASFAYGQSEFRKNGNCGLSLTMATSYSKVDRVIAYHSTYHSLNNKVYMKARETLDFGVSYSIKGRFDLGCEYIHNIGPGSRYEELKDELSIITKYFFLKNHLGDNLMLSIGGQFKFGEKYSFRISPLGLYASTGKSNITHLLFYITALYYDIDTASEGKEGHGGAVELGMNIFVPLTNTYAIAFGPSGIKTRYLDEFSVDMKLIWI